MKLYPDIWNPIPRPVVDRSPRLIERIKLEARWLLAGNEPIAEANDDERHQFLAAWSQIRCQRMPARDLTENFYEIAADQGTALAALILARRARCAR